MVEMVLVAGATGNTGRGVARDLMKAGVRVRAAARDRVKLLNLEVSEIAEIDFANPQSLARALRGIEAVYLALPVSPEMALLTEQLVAASVRAGAKRFVRLSGQGADLAQRLELGRWHRAAERVVEGSGLAWTHLRPSAFMQNFINHHLASMRVLGLFHDPVGECRVSYIDAKDISAVAARVLIEPGHENRTYTLTGPEALSSHEVAARFSAVSGREIRCVEVSVEAARDAMFGFGLPVAVVDAVAEWYRFMRDGKLAKLTTTVQEILGRAPHSFSEYASEQSRMFS